MPPDRSFAERHFMQIAAASTKFAAEHKIKPEVAREFLAADKAAGKFQAAPVSASNEGVTKQLASYNVGGVTDHPTQAPADRTYEFKTF
jgi:hypothetical protein